MRANPIYKRERTVGSRSIRLPMILTVFNSILALVALLNMYSMVSQVEVTAEIQYSAFMELYTFGAMIVFAMILFIMPALTAGSISGERERQTLDLLLSTQVTGLEVAAGKLMASMYNMEMTGYANQIGGIGSQGNSGGFLYLLLLNPAVTFYEIIRGQMGWQETMTSAAQWFGSRPSNLVLEAWVPVSVILQVALAGLFLAAAVWRLSPGLPRRRRSGEKKEESQGKQPV